jgi:signal transduction histidine kinase
MMSVKTRLPTIDPNISTKDQQLSSVAFLGQLALSGIVLDELFMQAASMLRQTLPVQFVMIWDLRADQLFQLRTATGPSDGATQFGRAAIEANSLEHFTIVSPDPLVIEDLKTETRFQPPEHYLEQGMTSGLSMLMGTVESSYGVIEVFSRKSQIFSQNDIFFMQSIANILATALQREQLQDVASSVPPDGMKSTDAENYEIKNRLNESRERERLRLAQELHDAPIQDLYGFLYQLDDLKDFLKGTAGEKIVAEYSETLQRVVNSLRGICKELRPPSLSPFGLEVAIRDHLEKFHDQNPQIEIHLELMRDQQILSDGLRLNLFRIYQQAISNVARHSAASEVHIRFRWDDNTIILEVEDNGRGFEIPKHWVEFVREEHFGLVGIAERVESMRGKLEIHSAFGSGTLVRAIVPRQEPHV